MERLCVGVLCSALGVALLVSAFAGAHANAECVQSDIAGRWQISASVTDPPSVHSIECEFDILEDGYIVAGSCHGPNLPDTPVTSGQINIEDAVGCSFGGQFMLGRTLTSVSNATLSVDEGIATGEGGYDQGSFSFTMKRHP